MTICFWRIRLEHILDELSRRQNVRENLSKLRQLIKDGSLHRSCRIWGGEHEALLLSFLRDEDAKTRKNAALLLGDLGQQSARDALWEAYRTENTLFVRSAYLTALSAMDVRELLPQLKQCLAALEGQEVSDENRKHVTEELRVLRAIVIRYEGVRRHAFSWKGSMQEVLLTTNAKHREVVRAGIGEGETKLHPLGVLVRTDSPRELMKLRTFRELLFVIHAKDAWVDRDPYAAAQTLWESDLYRILTDVHREDDPFYFRIEVKSDMTLEERSTYTKRLSGELERLSAGKLVNSTSDYEVELRLIANREGKFFPCLKCCTMQDNRFAYRKNTIATSIHPSTAALLMELAAPYLKEGAQLLDPFCGVGTMLVERAKRVPAGPMYATDIFGEAIEKGRKNVASAGLSVNFIHRDFFDFKHDYLFDEIVTNMPVRGKKSKEEQEALYQAFFGKALTHLKDDGVIVMYTGELGFVKKQLRLHREYHLLQETLMQTKGEFYLLIIGVKK